MFMESWILQVFCKVNALQETRSIHGFQMFIESWTVRVSCKVIEASLTLQETRSIHDSMNISKMEFIS